MRIGTSSPSSYGVASTAPPPSNTNTSLSATHKLKDCNVSFSGEGSVSEFLFKLDTLIARSKCPMDHLLANFQMFLTNKSEPGYWTYTIQNPTATYTQLKTALTKQFGYLESDNEIRVRISTRKQHLKESYDDSHTNIIRKNERVRDPILEGSLVEIIRSNVNHDIKVMLFGLVTRNLDELRDLARNAEKVIQEGKPRPRQVNEMSLEDKCAESEDESDPQVEALRINRQSFKSDYSKIKCWNCLKMRHSYIYCPDEAHLFCYKCGQRDVTTVKCSIRETSAGASRPLGTLVPRNKPRVVPERGRKSPTGKAFRKIDSI